MTARVIGTEELRAKMVELGAPPSVVLDDGSLDEVWLRAHGWFRQRGSHVTIRNPRFDKRAGLWFHERLFRLRRRVRRSR